MIAAPGEQPCCAVPQRTYCTTHDVGQDDTKKC
jgi:hypothetical protein